jgi:subtilisin family serine protease
MPLQSQIPFTEFTGRNVRVAIIDSGVNQAHTHVRGVAGGVGLKADGESGHYLDYVGHGTAVAGVIRQKAPEALLYAVKVFDQRLRTNAETIIRAIEWSVEHEMQVVNLSLGTLNQSHRERFEQAVALAVERDVVLVAAREMNGQEALPGCLPSVIGVALDWECPRETYRCVIADSRPTFFASGYPRSIPGVPAQRNLNGVSFAVANVAGFVARARQAHPAAALAELEKMLIEEAANSKQGKSRR